MPERAIVGCNVGFGELWPLTGKGTNAPYKRPTYIIGLGHEAQVGKDSLAAHLIKTFGPRKAGEWGKHFPIDIRRYAFGDELKVEVFDFLQTYCFLVVDESAAGLTIIDSTNLTLPDFRKTFSREEKIAWINGHKHNPEIRKLLQIHGTEFRRTQNKDYWRDKTMAQIKSDSFTSFLPQVAVITDMRFANEGDICDVRINVSRPGFQSGVAKHVSEAGRGINYDYFLPAVTLDELFEKGETLVEGLLIKEELLPSPNDYFTKPIKATVGYDPK